MCCGTIGSFFSQLAVVTFGGAYAVLAYMAQEAVQNYGWLSAGEMADGLGLAETTPGPLIMVTQFVGFLAAYRAPEPFTPFVAGLLGAGLTTWVTFAPCFLWIFAFAPWIDRLRHATRLDGELSALTAAVVGVMPIPAVWFALHVLFARVDEARLGPLNLSLPQLSSFDWRAAVLAILAAVLVFAVKWSPIRTPRPGRGGRAAAWSAFLNKKRGRSRSDPVAAPRSVPNPAGSGDRESLVQSVIFTPTRNCRGSTMRLLRPSMPSAGSPGRRVV